VGECFFWYRPARIVPDQRPLNGCVCVVSSVDVVGQTNHLVIVFITCTYCMIVASRLLVGTSIHNTLFIKCNSIIIITTTMFMVYHHDQRHSDSSPGSSDECRLSDEWPPTLRPSQSTWVVSPPKIGSYHPYPPSLLLLLLSP